MADPQYQTANMILRSRGVVSRMVDDAPPSGENFWLNEENIEEIEENGLATRLGTTILSQEGGIARPIEGDTGTGFNNSVHSLARLDSLPTVFAGPVSWRYAARGHKLYRLRGLNPGAYTLIYSALSGFPWGKAVYSPSVTGYPYLYIADLFRMLKDNGTLAAPQQMGIFQPQYPVQSQAQDPDEIVLDPFAGSVVFTTTTAAITSTGIQNVPVVDPSVVGLFQSLIIDVGLNQETVLVILTTATGITANFTKTHSSGVSVVEFGTSTSVGASSTGSISNAIATSISTWPTTLSQSDYIGLWLYVSDPNAIESITLQFNTANGAYFYRTIGQGPLQATINATTDSSTAAADAVISGALGLYTSGSGGVTGLSTIPGWTPILVQLSDFSSAGEAAFDDPVKNWQNVTSYELKIVTGPGIAGTVFPVTVTMASLILFGGAGPDSFAGVSYDYLVTLFNIQDYTESNPSMVQSDVDPPSLTNRVLPRRQPVLLSWINGNTDTQATHWRVYRRGGTLGDNYRRIDQIPITAATGGTQTYRDIWSDLDIQQAPTVSFTNDVPVTSPLPTPVNDTLGVAIGTMNQVVNVTLGTGIPVVLLGGSISPAQQVSIGNVLSANFETVIVLSVIVGGSFGSLIMGFTAFVQNTHELGEPITATAQYGKPLDIMAVAFDQGWFGGDQNNPSNLYWSPKGNVQVVSSAAYEPVSYPGDPLTAIVGSHGNLFVSTVQRWYSVAPGTTVGGAPTIYPTAVDHGCVGKRAWTLRDGVIYYLSLDGLRTFTGGGGQYISEIIEFVWQGIGTTPIPIADAAQFSTVQVSWWNKMVFFSYIALDGLRHRIILDVDNKRYRVDDIDAQSMFLEDESSTLVWGDSQGLIHLDRQPVSYDEINVAGVVTQRPIAITLQTPYGNQGMPEVEKQMQEFTLDCNTNGIPVTCKLLLNDGESSLVLGTVTTTERQRVNLNIQNGEGIAAYKTSLLLTGSSIERIFLYQAKIKYLPLAMTRRSLDTFQLRFSTDESKICKQAYFEYTANAVISGAIYYDDSPTIGFPFTLPQYSGVRNSLRVRLPAVSFRLLRCILTSTADFRVWNESAFEVKPLCQGKGYQKFPMMP